MYCPKLLSISSPYPKRFVRKTLQATRKVNHRHFLVSTGIVNISQSITILPFESSFPIAQIGKRQMNMLKCRADSMFVFGSDELVCDAQLGRMNIETWKLFKYFVRKKTVNFYTKSFVLDIFYDKRRSVYLINSVMIGTYKIILCISPPLLFLLYHFKPLRLVKIIAIFYLNANVI